MRKFETSQVGEATCYEVPPVLFQARGLTVCGSRRNIIIISLIGRIRDQRSQSL